MIGNVHDSTLSLSGSIKFEGPGDEQRTAEFRHAPTVELVTGIILGTAAFITIDFEDVVVPGDYARPFYRADDVLAGTRRSP